MPRGWPRDFLDKIICGDCLQVMSEIPDVSVDLVFADPPFNVGKAYWDKRDNYEQWCASWIRECFRLLKPTGTFYLMTLPRHLSHTMRSMDAGGIFVDQIIWRTTSLNATRKQYLRSYQLILEYAKTEEYLFHPRAEIVMRTHTVRLGQLKKKPELASGYPGRIGNLWDDIKFIAGGCMAPREAILQKGSKKKAHPCQMPEKLAARAIKFSSDPGDIVLDPFIGSGSTAVAARRGNRRYIGIEIERSYCRLARKRLNEI